jgi:hypothetical protein
MSRSYPLTDRVIDDAVSRRSAGNYALGYLDGTAFLVFYVGRSDSDVNRELHGWVGSPSRHKRYAPSAKAPCGSRRRRLLPLDSPSLDRVGLLVESGYTRFAFRYASCAEAAFEKQCRNFHDLGGSDGLDNERHPVPPLGKSWKCPVHARWIQGRGET